ncbi:MAG: DUF3179 domain-containing (seleno)protein [Planctomycetota bacterium]
MAVAAVACSGLLIAASLTAWARWPESEYHCSVSEKLAEARQQRLAEPAALFDWSGLIVPREQVISGGVPKDGIPSITDPQFAPAASQTQWEGDARVVGVVVGDKARAYPLAMLNRHEIVNDTLGGTPIAVVFCPLCDSVSVVDRRPPGEGEDVEPLEFGVSGMLMNSNVLLYDRTHDALWSQVAMTAMTGPYAGQFLRHLGGWSLGPLSAFTDANPDATVMVVDEAVQSQYARNVYADRGYFEDEQVWFPYASDDNRLSVKEPILGLHRDGQTWAFPLEAWSGHAGPVRHAFADGAEAVFEFGGDREVAVASLPEDADAVHTFWFAWVSFNPQTQVVLP